MAPPAKKHKPYTEEQMIEAVERIKNKEITYKQANALYNISASTLHDKVRGRRVRKLKKGNYVIKIVISHIFRISPWVA